MSGWPFVDLAEISDISAGNPAPQGAHHFSDDGAPFVRMQDVGRTHINPALTETIDRVSPSAIRECGLRLYPAGTLLVPKSGASVNLNHRAMLGTEAYVVSHLATIIPDQSKVLPSYLFHWSRLYDPRSQAQVTSLPSLPLSLIKTAKVPLPPLDEQRRIVVLLDQAEAIRRRADTARQTARALIPALFTQTFGDPATNPKGWEMAKLGDLTGVVLRNGVSPSKAGEVVGKVLTLSAITRGGFDGAAVKESMFAAAPHTEQTVSRTSFLICRGNGNPALVGRGAFPSIDMPDTIFPDTMIALSGVSGRLQPLFLSALWATDFTRSQINTAAKTTNGTYKISQESIRSFMVLLPPLPLQTAFAAKARRIEAMAHALDAATAKAEAMAASLSARLFGQASPPA